MKDTQRQSQAFCMVKLAAGQATELDIVIGKRIRLCRQARKISQTKLAGEVGVAWQQIQKYEAGKNRVSASMLWRIAEVFDMPLSYFFEDLTDDLDGNKVSREEIPVWRADDISRIYDQLGSAERDAVCSFLKSVVGSSLQREPVE